MENNPEKDWKLKLRYGKIDTPYQHFTVIAEGIAKEVAEEFECPDGNAIMAMKAWAVSSGEAMNMIQFIGADIGFTVTGRIEVFDSEAQQPPTENPYGYGIQFTPFS